MSHARSLGSVPPNLRARPLKLLPRAKALLRWSHPAYTNLKNIETLPAVAPVSPPAQFGAEDSAATGNAFTIICNPL